MVSQDADFQESAQLQGGPPKVIWLQSGTTSTEAMGSLFMSEHARIEQFPREPESSCLVVAAENRLWRDDRINLD